MVVRCCGRQALAACPTAPGRAHRAAPSPLFLIVTCKHSACPSPGPEGLCQPNNLTSSLFFPSPGSGHYLAFPILKIQNPNRSSEIDG